MRPALLLVPLLLAGCLGGTATPGAGEVVAFDLDDVKVTWRPAEEPTRERALVWEVVNASWRDGVGTIETTTHGVEGGDFRFTLRYRTNGSAGGGATLAYDENLSRDGTFTFFYTESIFWAGRPIERVERVDPASWVRVDRLDLEDGALAGAFHLEFVGACERECQQGGPTRHATVLDGRFQSPRWWSWLPWAD